MFPLIAAGVGIAGGLLGKFFDKTPEWQDISLLHNLGLRTDRGAYDFGEAETGSEFERMKGLFGQGKGYLDEALGKGTMGLRMGLSEATPTAQTYRSLFAGGGMGGAVSNTLALENAARGQRQSQEAFYKGLLGLQGQYQGGLLDWLGTYENLRGASLDRYMKAKGLTTQYATEADWQNKKFFASTTNEEITTNAQGRFGRNMAAWQNRQSVYNELTGMGLGVLGYQMTRGWNGNQTPVQGAGRENWDIYQDVIRNPYKPPTGPEVWNEDWQPRPEGGPY